MNELFIIPILAIHLLTLNLASVGPVICIWLGYGKHTTNPWSDQIGKQLAWASLAALLVGMLLGGLLWLPDNRALHAAISRFPARTYWYAAAELVFSLVLLYAYAATWNWRKNCRKPQRLLHSLLALMTVTNLLYHFPPLMVVIGKLAVNAHWAIDVVASGPIDHQGFLKLMLRGEVLALSMHFIVASLVVSAVTYLGLLARSLKVLDSIPQDTPESTEMGSTAPEQIQLAGRAANIAILGTLLQIPTGIWVLLTIPPASRQAVLGSNLPANICFGVGIMTTLAFVQQLLLIAQGEFNRPAAKQSAWLLGLVVLLMVVTLRT
ncbi:MAG: hypothetical protein ABGX16_14150 [Pirellulales bacterium]